MPDISGGHCTRASKVHIITSQLLDGQ